VRDANAIGTTTVYDSRNRATTVTDTATGALQAVTRATYDKHSNVKTQTDAMLMVTSFAYDGRDRKTRSTDPLPTITDFTYDANGNLLTIVDGDSAQRPAAADRRTIAGRPTPMTSATCCGRRSIRPASSVRARPVSAPISMTPPAVC